MKHINNIGLVASVIFSMSMMTSALQAQPIDDPNIKFAEVHQDSGVLVFTIDNTPANLTSVDVMRSLNRFMDIAADKKEIGALVITGKGDAFSLAGSDAGGDTLGEMTPSQYAMATFDRIEQFPLPVIAAVNGDAGQGGLELSMSADIRIASSEASFTQMEVVFGVIPGFGGLQRLPDLVGRSLATDMILTGRKLSAKEALSAGLVSRISPADQVLDDAMKLAKTLAEKLPRESVASVKTRLFDARNQTFSDALRSDHVAFDKLAFSPEFQARLKAERDAAK